MDDDGGDDIERPRRTMADAFEDARKKAGGSSRSGPPFDLPRMQEQLARSFKSHASLLEAAERLAALQRPKGQLASSSVTDGIDVAAIPPRPEPQLLRDLIAVQKGQTDVLQALVASQVAGEAAAEVRDDRAHRLGRAGVVAGLEAAVLTVILGTGQYEDLSAWMLVSGSTAVVAVCAAAYADWRPVGRRLRRRRQT